MSRYSPNRVHFYDEHVERASRGRSRTPQTTHSRESSYSPSRSRSRSRPRASYREPSKPVALKEDKPWYQKKTMWSGLATIATVAALVPSAVSAKASRDSADASGRAARASEKSAKEVSKSAKASMLSARAAANSSIAQGHMDFNGNVIHKDEAGRQRIASPRVVSALTPLSTSGARNVPYAARGHHPTRHLVR